MPETQFMIRPKWHSVPKSFGTQFPVIPYPELSDTPLVYLVGKNLPIADLYPVKDPAPIPKLSHLTGPDHAEDPEMP